MLCRTPTSSPMPPPLTTSAHRDDVHRRACLRVPRQVRENQLVSLPQSIGALDKLMKLQCKMNQLRQVPHSIGELRNLQLLELDQARSMWAHVSMRRTRVQHLGGGANGHDTARA